MVPAHLVPYITHCSKTIHRGDTPVESSVLLNTTKLLDSVRSDVTWYLPLPDTAVAVSLFDTSGTHNHPILIKCHNVLSILGLGL